MPHVIVSGIDYKGHPLEIRERILIPHHCLSFALRRLLACSTIDEVVILSTCNRFEIYAATNEVAKAQIELSTFFDGVQRIPEHEKINPDYTLLDDAAALHLFRVASGLESMITGEGQILSQLKQSYKIALEQNTAGPTLNRLFQLALHCGKRVRHETTIASRAVSTGAAAIELVGRHLDSWNGINALVIGAGGAGQMCVKHLLSLKHKPHLTVLNQTINNLEAVRRIAKSHPVVLSREFTERHRLAAEADVVFVTTGADTPLIMSDTLHGFGRLPSFVVDMAVPRNVDPGVGLIPGVSLYTIDDLVKVVDTNLAERNQLYPGVKAIIDEVLARRWRVGVAHIAHGHQRIPFDSSSSLMKLPANSS